MKSLVVEDEMSARMLLSHILSEYGPCDLAENGQEALEAFHEALAEQKPYDLLCLDIMMPEMNGHEVLRSVRELEEQNEIHGLDGVKIIMTTALDDSKNIFAAFREQCEAYLVKPIRKEKLIECIHEMKII